MSFAVGICTNHLVVCVFALLLNITRQGCSNFQIDMLDVDTSPCLTLATLLDSSLATLVDSSLATLLDSAPTSPLHGQFPFHNAKIHLPLLHEQFLVHNVVSHLLRALSDTQASSYVSTGLL